MPLRSRKMVPVALITRLEMRPIFGVAFQLTRYVCCLPQLVGTYYSYLPATTRHYSSIPRPRTSSRPPDISEAPQRSAPNYPARLYNSSGTSYTAHVRRSACRRTPVLESCMNIMEAGWHLILVPDSSALESHPGLLPSAKPLCAAPPKPVSTTRRGQEMLLKLP